VAAGPQPSFTGTWPLFTESPVYPASCSRNFT